MKKIHMISKVNYKEYLMKYIASILLTIILLVTSSGSVFMGDQPESASAYSGIPTFSIVSVKSGKKVTISTYNFPKSDTFKVLMNYMGTRGVNGIKVDTISSGSGGSFTATFSIPSSLKKQHQIAIRLQSTSGSGYYSYNWFYNTTYKYGTGGAYTTTQCYCGYPTFSIIGVKKNKTVTIKTYNLPKNDTFKVLMNNYGTNGVGGVKAGTINTGSGGTKTFTINIPASMKGKSKIAIRIQSTSGTGYYAYNWFYNSNY
jgi:hypothetical protein